jgi:ABC-type xylose transport system permease subunit
VKCACHLACGLVAYHAGDTMTEPKEGISLYVIGIVAIVVGVSSFALKSSGSGQGIFAFGGNSAVKPPPLPVVVRPN